MHWWSYLMRLRELRTDDAPFMYEWMQDDDVVQYLWNDFKTKKISDCESFISSSLKETNNLNLAIVDDNDTYMGTVSLKKIQNGVAEFGIVVRKQAMGKGYSKYGMDEIFRIGFEKLKLEVQYIKMWDHM